MKVEGYWRRASRLATDGANRLTLRGKSPPDVMGIYLEARKAKTIGRVETSVRSVTRQEEPHASRRASQRVRCAHGCARGLHRSLHSANSDQSN